MLKSNKISVLFMLFNEIVCFISVFKCTKRSEGNYQNSPDIRNQAPK